MFGAIGKGEFTLGQRTKLTPHEAAAISQALNQGEADIAFILLADYLQANDMALADDTLRLYIERELFDCFKGRGDRLSTILNLGTL